MNEDVKIIQILIGPENAKWQGCLFGLGSDGVVYQAEHKDGKCSWIVSAPLNFEAVN